LVVAFKNVEWQIEILCVYICVLWGRVGLSAENPFKAFEFAFVATDIRL